jgi:NDP-sugar pyrophosphorylase family protein
LPVAAGLALVILAAGVGSRFGGMKQLAGVSAAGHALMDYAIYDALEAGFQRVVFVVSEDTEEPVRAHAEAGCARRTDVRYALQRSDDRPKPWGTGHAVLSARPFMEGAFGVINADDYYGRRSLGLLGEGLSEDGRDHLLVGYTLRETLSAFGGVSRGLCLLDGDRLKSVVELHEVRADGEGVTSANPEWRRLTGDEVISTNLWGFRPTFMDVLEGQFAEFQRRHGDDEKAEFYIGTAVNALLESDGPGVRVVRTADQFFGMTFADDLPKVKEEIGARIDRGEYPDPLWE